MKAHKRLYLKVIPSVFVLSCLYIICIPRYYTTEVKLAPEVENTMSGGTLGSLASTFGFDLSGMQSTDAISPMLYPDLMEDNGFVTKFFNFKVESADGEIKTTYHDYLVYHQQYPWWAFVKEWMKKMMPKKEEKVIKGGNSEFNPYILPRLENEVVEAIKSKIKLDVDKKTGVITATVKDQDRLICKTIADSVRNQLQAFITEYRTNKARVDLDYYKKLVAEAKHDYERARQLYGSYSDANTDVVLQSFRSKQDDLENDMQLKFNTYSALSTQLQQAKAKVQERTPAFTLLKGAEVPIKPAGPKRMIFVLAMTILAFIVLTLYSTKDLLISQE
jgi:hypothetical protein